MKKLITMLTLLSFYSMSFSQVYESYKRVKYKELPEDIKTLMKKCKCGEIDAEPNQYNDYTTNYDEGFAIDLNNDKILEYAFACEASSHGPATGKIYSYFGDRWNIIEDGFPIFENCKPEIAIQLLPTKSGGFRDIIRHDILTSRPVIMRYIFNQYYCIYTPIEAVNKVEFFMENQSNGLHNCYFGFSSLINDSIKSKYLNVSDNSKIICAFESVDHTNQIKDLLLSKGFKFINECSKGNILFCYTINPK